MRIEHPRIAALLAVGACLVLLIGIGVGAVAGGQGLRPDEPER